MDVRAYDPKKTKHHFHSLETSFIDAAAAQLTAEKAHIYAPDTHIHINVQNWMEKRRQN